MVEDMMVEDMMENYGMNIELLPYDFPYCSHSLLTVSMQRVR